jgi:hypothetical protein
LNIRAIASLDRGSQVAPRSVAACDAAWVRSGANSSVECEMTT